jgi:hypothetical protein
MAFGATSAFAGTWTHRSGHVSFWIPDNWKLDGDEQTQLTATDPNGEVALAFFLHGHKSMSAAIAAIDETIANVATDVKTGAPQTVEINGMEGSVVDGSGVAFGKRVEISVLILKTPGNKYLMIFGVLESAHKLAHSSELKQILASLKPVR